MCAPIRICENLYKRDKKDCSSQVNGILNNIKRKLNLKNVNTLLDKLLMALAFSISPIAPDTNDTKE